MEEGADVEDEIENERRMTSRGVSLDRIKEKRGRVRTGIKREAESGESSTSPKLSRDKQTSSNETKQDTSRSDSKLEGKREGTQH